MKTQRRQPLKFVKLLVLAEDGFLATSQKNVLSRVITFRSSCIRSTEFLNVLFFPFPEAPPDTAQAKV